MTNQLILTTPADLREIVTAAVRSELAGLKQPDTPTANQEWLTRKQTAARLQVSLVTLHSWTKTGIVKGYRISGRIRYKSHEVESALQAMQTYKNRG
ncbi:MAG: helix-turn-helix domain-containing protein [Bacteroidetes bacterium]|nr:helix-turn-helix domain-containing protein [Bacteroidota bacterium]